jgi:hypothetical protein
MQPVPATSIRNRLPARGPVGLRRIEERPIETLAKLFGSLLALVYHAL